MNDCDFCADNYTERFSGRVYFQHKEFVVARPRHPLHELHLLVFYPYRHNNRLHQYSNKKISDLKNLIKSLDRAFDQELNDYLGYNLVTNNGEREIGQHYSHAHVHLFMRYKSEVSGPFDPPNENLKHSKLNIHPPGVLERVGDRVSKAGI